MPSDDLARYKAKRDFSKTAEPSGESGVASSPRLRFVIQKHAATRLHYDLRLELDGVFKSWAVTRGPSLDPHDKRLAVEVEDHPLAYGDFEGTIARGQYGGGSVQLWDRGYWQPEGSPETALKSGDFKFQLDGQRLHGSWVLVRMKHDRNGGKRTNWLLIKHRDEWAREGDADALLAEDRSVASGRAMAEIAAGKGRGPKPFMLDTRKSAKADAVWNSNRGDSAPAPSTSATTANIAADKATPATAKKVAGMKVKALPEFVAPQLCRLANRPPSGDEWVHEIKLDGYRLQLRIEHGRASLRTRKGLNWTGKFPEIAQAAARLPDAIIDGEVVAANSGGLPDFAALQAALSNGATDDLIFYAFDLLFAGGADLRELTLADRKAHLETMLAAQSEDVPTPIHYVEHLHASGDDILESARQMSLEGIVSKRLDAPYRSGRTASSWIKVKCRPGQEVVVGAWTDTAGHFRSLLVGVHRDGHLAYAGRVGTGFGQDVVERILPRLKALAAAESPFSGDNAPRPQSNIHWVKPELVAEIEFSNWTEGGMVRAASFKGLREDKPAAEITIEQSAAVKDAGTAGLTSRTDSGLTNGDNKPSQRKEVTVSPASQKPKEVMVLEVTISNPEKAMWPDGGDGKPVTKLDLAHYYEAVGPWMITHLKGRPCSIIRAPDGIGGEQFFQRHAMPGTSKLLELTTVSGDRKPYLQIDRVEGLAAIAQVAGLELHPWNCQPGQPDVAGRLVFDLDPAPDVDFATVVESAREVKDRLEALGLICFCKTTGGKGIHVVTPLAAGKKDAVGWTEAKAFAREVCLQMAADSPARYLINMSKKERTGKIFLDYLRNDRMSTAVAPLSPRAREGATVSMPVSWSQVRAGLDPRRFTIRTAPALIKKSAAWKDYCEAERPLGAAQKRLSKGSRK
ncbi:MAG TPA: DNA ligase D [Candidatus Binataceae bacterium]